MGISLAEATGLLLLGKKVTWNKFKNHRAGSIVLDKPEQRRLLEFLLGADSNHVASGDESLFADLVAAWENGDYDPAKATAEAVSKDSSQSWRLDRIEAFNFGGLTIFGGKPFDLYVGGNNWCLEGQNGSGKTSLVSAILWALTGKRIREHEGPVNERGARENVESDDGTKVGDWPPLAAYPTTIADLGKQAEVWVRLLPKHKSTTKKERSRTSYTPNSNRLKANRSRRRNSGTKFTRLSFQTMTYSNLRQAHSIRLPASAI
jgi:AAA domain